MSLEIKLQKFEGPLDLLLHLIEKNKVSIYDIPIVEITQQYLDYLQMMKENDLDIMSEFMVMAATLLDIKSRMLLPEDVSEEDDDTDPRAELVEQLVEYKLYKTMAVQLRDQQISADRIFYRKPVIPDEVAQYTPPVNLEELVGDVTLKQLNEIFKSTLKRQRDKIDPIRSQFGEIKQEEISVEDKMKQLREIASTKKEFSFKELLEAQPTRTEVIVTFLAILELMRAGTITIKQEHAFDDIYITSKAIA